MKKILVLGYGNPDRGDDGIAWHILNDLCTCFSIDSGFLLEGEVFPLNLNADCWFGFQLIPEIADLISKYQKLIFIDAHNSPKLEDLSFKYNSSRHKPVTINHHLTPSGLLGIAKTLGLPIPSPRYFDSWFEFGFHRTLSPMTEKSRIKAILILRQMVELT